MIHCSLFFYTFLHIPVLIMLCWTSNSCHKASGRFIGPKIVFEAPNWQSTSSSFCPSRHLCLSVLSWLVPSAAFFLWDRRKNLKKLYLYSPFSGGAICAFGFTHWKEGLFLLFWHLRFMHLLESFDCLWGETCPHVGLRGWIQTQAAFSVLQTEILHFSSFAAELLLFKFSGPNWFCAVFLFSSGIFVFDAPNKVPFLLLLL